TAPPKNNLMGPEPLAADGVGQPTPDGVPPSPQPLTHPANRPWPFGRRGLLFGVRLPAGVGHVAKRRDRSGTLCGVAPWTLRALSAFWTGVGAGLADLSLGTKPGACSSGARNHQVIAVDHLGPAS